jgi:hypothetical protein
MVGFDPKRVTMSHRILELILGGEGQEMSNEQDWADWVQKLGPGLSAIGTFAAVVVSLTLASRSRKKDQSEQASQVTAWFTGPEMELTQAGEGKANVNVTINNGSHQVVYDLIAQVVPVGPAGAPAAKHLNLEHGSRLGAIPPGGRTVPLRYPGAGMHKRLGIELAFQDAAGRYWFRAAQGTLKRLRHHPIDFYGLDRPVSWN